MHCIYFRLVEYIATCTVSTSASCNGWNHRRCKGSLYHCKHKVQRSGCMVQRSGPTSAQVGTGCSNNMQLVLAVVVTGSNLRWWWFSLSHWHRLPFHPLAQIPDLHSGNLHCVVVVFWWWWWYRCIMYVVVNKETVLTFEQFALCGGVFWWWWHTYVNVTVVVVSTGWVYPLQCGVHPSTHWRRYRTFICTRATCTVFFGGNGGCVIMRRWYKCTIHYVPSYEIL